MHPRLHAWCMLGNEVLMTSCLEGALVVRVPKHIYIYLVYKHIYKYIIIKAFTPAVYSIYKETCIYVFHRVWIVCTHICIYVYKCIHDCMPDLCVLMKCVWTGVLKKCYCPSTYTYMCTYLWMHSLMQYVVNVHIYICIYRICIVYIRICIYIYKCMHYCMLDLCVLMRCIWPCA